MNITSKGMLIAASAAALLASTALRAGDSSAAKNAKVHCAGINSCKGEGKCGGDGHNCKSCKGYNTCKGKGWIVVSAAVCKKKKGTVIPEKADEDEPASTPAAK